MRLYAPKNETRIELTLEERRKITDAFDVLSDLTTVMRLHNCEIVKCDYAVELSIAEVVNAEIVLDNLLQIISIVGVDEAP